MSVNAGAFILFASPVQSLFHEQYNIYSYEWSAVLIPVLTRNVSLLHNFHTDYGTHPASYSVGRGVISGGRAAGS
jgi:hypothetical protein